ncbi:RIIa domain-containing protein 1 [Acanthochromis polyacanthus]|uniref:Regulatory subunit of type II PKA R-subunit domain containing 1 n=1 Tax=Acanthochromis polyacanthus TaxID=80966 RepID=A0A3Q1FUS6_9TELE|nr:RIIa domain-containing protein 1 [Acanthochromis polyacanthus]
MVSFPPIFNHFILEINNLKDIFSLLMAGKGVSTKLDVGVLSSEQQEKLKQFKIKTRIENEKYLRSHPEVEVLIGDFLRDLLLKRPADVREFAADHFTNPNLHETVSPKVESSSNVE